MNLFGVGHSHLGAAIKGASEIGVPIARFILERNRGEENRESRLAFWHDLAAAIARERPSHLLCFVGGSVHAMLATQRHEIPFDFILPAQPGLPLDRNARILPFAAVRATIEDYIRSPLRVLNRLRGLGVAMSQFECPPPIFDNAVLSERVRQFPEILAAAAPPGDFAASNPWLRYKLWLLQSQMFRDFARPRRIAYILNPASVLDRRGFLRLDCLQDSFHGNARYGALVLSDWLATAAAPAA